MQKASRLRRAHLLGVEDDLAGLKGDLAVVNGLRGLLCRVDAHGSATNAIGI